MYIRVKTVGHKKESKRNAKSGKDYYNLLSEMKNASSDLINKLDR